MDVFSETPPETPPPEPARRPRRRHRGGLSLRLTTSGIIILLVVDIIVVGMLAWPLITRLAALANVPPSATVPVASLTASPSSTLTTIPETPTPLPSPTPTLLAPYPQGQSVSYQGVVVLSMQEGAHSHIFAYQPQSLPLTRLTSGPWDDVSPSLSSDGKRLVFASNRNGYWNLYLLELSSGQVSRLTDSLSYMGAPSLSPDGLWMAYEAYTSDQPGGLDIYIRQVSGGDAPIRLTESSGADYSPAWSPLGRQVAFISDRSGRPHVWLADLDKTGDQRFRDLSSSDTSLDSHPAWSPDGHALAWASVDAGYHQLVVRQVAFGDQPDQPARQVGSGDWPVWSPDGRVILSTLLEPNQTALVAYPLDVPGIVYPPMRLPGAVSGLAWSGEPLPEPLSAEFQQAAQITPTPLYNPVISPVPGMPGGRQSLVTLKDVDAPHPQLNDLVDESFQSLRSALALEAGWDVLASLENAYVPLTSALDPGMFGDWLFTGRAFTFNPLPINAGWIVVTREDFGADTYWRVYVKARSQDGSAGAPLHVQPWDFSARYSGDPYAYEQGGALAKEIPAGYWLDLTQIAAAYDWQRLPALLTWRSAYQEARFNEFALMDGLSWEKAMMEIYPPEVLITPTPLVPPTRTLTPTPRWYQSPTPTLTETPRPTWTPYTPEPPTPLPTDTPAPTGTSTSVPTLAETSTPAPNSTLSISPTHTP